ncbi:DUF2723 domain-containing protein [candidate division KSB1 bacterium]|nr:DUF2723 domain-containing protein [candidate division KSB1 bacterium]
MEQERFTHRLIALIIFLISMVVYYLTIAPTTSFWDCGEFIACSYILGVPHPPGAPFYLLLGRIFSMIPWAADIGLRVNLISALTTALTIMLTYLIIARLIILWRGNVRTIEDRIILYGGSIIGALALAFSDSVWFNAVEAEVYAISLFFTAIIVWLILVWHEKTDDPTSDKYIFLIAYCIGLAIGIHLLNILALPAIYLIFYFKRYKVTFISLLLLIGIGAGIFSGIYPGIVKGLPNLALFLKNNFGASLTAVLFLSLIGAVIALTIFAVRNRIRILFLVVMSFILIVIGASTFTGIYIRSNLNPAIDENDPENLENLVSYVNREQYGDWSITERRAPLWEYQIKKMYLRYLGWQFMGKGTAIGADGFLAETMSLQGLWGIPFLIGIMGMIHHFFKDYRRALAILFLFVMTGLAIVIYLNQTDPQPRERDYVFVASFFAFAIWIGIGVAGIFETIVESVHSNSWLRRTLMALVAVLILVLVPINMLAFNYHTHDRSGNYVAYDYSYNLLQSCEPDAILFTNGDNDTFPLWFLQYVYNIRRDVRVVNLSLLNTPWYIKQLRDQEPRVPINLADAQINQLSATYWPDKKIVKIEVPIEIYQQELGDLELRKEFIDKTMTSAPEITFELGPTFMGQAIRVQDIMILNIIASNQFKKPLYFAVTVSPENMINMDDYLRMDGLAYKLVTYPGDRISPSRLQENFFNRFSFRNLNNPDVYYDDNITGLIINYRSGFLRLANFYRQEKMYDEMLRSLDKMNEALPEEVIPVTDKRISFGVGQMYLEGGRPEEFEKRIEFWFNQPELSADEKLEFAQIYYQYLKNHIRSEAIALELIQKNPNYLRGYYWLFNLYSEIKAYAKGIDLAQRLLTINPNDSQAKVRLNQFQTLLESSSDSTILK